MNATFQSAKHALVPPELSREQVITHLQKYETIIRMQPVVEHFARIKPENLDHCLADPFFTQDKEGGPDITTYEIFERVPNMPLFGISQLIRFPVYFQDCAEGVRSRVDAPAGTCLRTTYTVRPVERDGVEQVGRGGWLLVEEADVECNVLLKPFIANSFHDAHTNVSENLGRSAI